MAEGSFKRRGRHDIILQILENAKEGARKTSIMFEARLSYSQLEKY
jgi:predicted transcriptional regulator